MLTLAPSIPEPNKRAAKVDALPPLRQDLRLISCQGGERVDGGNAKIWRIHDPLSQRFFAVDRDCVEILSLWHLATAGAIRDAMMRQTGKVLNEEKLAGLVKLLQINHLTRSIPGYSFARLRQSAQLQRRPLGSRVLHGYLFFKFPLARPDAFLRRTLPYLTFMFHRAFWIAVGVLGLIGLYLTSRRWDAFLSTFPDMLSTSGVITFAASLALVKTLHELGHGYTAARMGSRVTTMGVAFIVMAPVLYTDTTDAWRLPRRQRVLIDAAGIMVELLVAVLATLTWVFLPDGALRHAAFSLATTSWVLSLAINLNPFLRFDGYYLFSDLLGIPNLQERSFAMGRWWLRELLFGFGDEQPLAIYGRSKVFLVAFAYATWIYRFFLFLGIALVVYHYFFKLLGVFLFMVEIIWFLAMPAWREAGVWFKRRRDASARVYMTALVLGASFAVLLVPLPYKVRIPAVLTAAQQAPVFAPRSGQIKAVLVRQGEAIRAGQVLVELVAPEIEWQLDNSVERKRLLHERLDRRTADLRDLSESLVLDRELALESDRINGLELEQSRLSVRAPIDGVIADLKIDLPAGRWIDDKSRLALVAKPGALEARGYVDAADLSRIAVGDKGRFVDESRLNAPRDIQVVQIGVAAVEQLDNWLLASSHGGPVAARSHEGALVPEHSVFEIVASAQGSIGALPSTEIRGELHLRGSPQSLGLRMLKRVAHVLVREAGA